MDDGDILLFSEQNGFAGNKSYSLKYATKSRNFRYEWPHNNTLSRSSDGSGLLQNIIDQKVGLDRTWAYQNQCDTLKEILDKFLRRHKNTDYKALLRKCQNCYACGKPRDALQPETRKVVKNYLHRIIFNVMPLELFGTKENALVFERNLRSIIFFGQSQSFSLKMVMKNVRFRGRSYLNPIDECINKTNLLAKLHLWLIKVYIFAALKCVFYVVNSNYSKKFLFYDKCVWQRVYQKKLNEIPKHLLRVYKNGYVSDIVKKQNVFLLKIIPKRRGSRPIYVKWKKEPGWKSKSTNISLSVKAFLNRLDSSCFSSLDSVKVFQTKWRDLHSKWKSNSSPPVYYVRVDFLGAFENIYQEKLLLVIKKLMDDSNDRSDIVYKYWKWSRKAPYRQTVETIQDYIAKCCFKDNKNLYQLRQGICQGGVISSLLCNLYLGSLDRTHLMDFVNDANGFLIRNIDDYIYVTLDRQKAIDFLGRMEEGFDDYNMHINKSKTKTNLYDDSLNTVAFGGRNLDVNTFELYICAESFQDGSVFHKTKLRTVSSPGRLLLKRFVFTCCAKLHDLYFDSVYNSEEAMLYNVYTNSLILALRYFAFVERLFDHYNFVFIFRCIIISSRRTAAAVKQKITATSIISDEVVKWVVFKAFLTKLRTIRSKLRMMTTRIEKTMNEFYSTFDEQQKQLVEMFHSITTPSFF